MIEYCIAQKEHISQILELYKQLIPDEKPLDTIKADEIWDNIQKNNIKYFIAIDDGIVVSSCYLAIIPNLTRGGKSNGFIENVITDAHYRNRGIGKNIIKMAIEYGKQNNCYKIVLQSSTIKTEAHTFYEKCGFNGNSKRAFEIRF